MRRITLQRAVERVVRDVREAGVLGMFQEAFRETRASNKEGEKDFVSFEVFRDYTLRTSSYGEGELDVLAHMQLTDLLSPAFWQRLPSFDRPEVYDYLTRLRLLTERLPNIIGLLQRDYESYKPGEDTVPAERELQTVVLTDDDDDSSSPERLIYVLQAFTGLYSVSADLENLPGNSLSVAGIDSGSEKSFDFLGIAKLMQEARETLLALWNAIIFHRHNLASRNLSVINDALPIVARIHALEQSEAIDHEHAARLKNRVLTSITKFVEAGATIPEMEGASSFQPKQLMKPQPKLLAAPPGVITESDTSGDQPVEHAIDEFPSEAGFTEEQLAQIQTLLNAGKPGRKASSTKRPRRRAPKQ